MTKPSFKRTLRKTKTVIYWKTTILPDLLHEIEVALSDPGACAIIVVDGGSSDSTPVVLDKIQSRTTQ